MKKFLALGLGLLFLNVCSAQSIQKERDTVRTGCLYLINPMTFELKSGYLWRITDYELSYEPAQTNRQNGDSLTLVKVRKPLVHLYYLTKNILGHTNWISVACVADFNKDFTLTDSVSRNK